MIRVISVVGARPNFMKVAPIHRAFQAVSDQFEHHIVHTGQHYDASMSDAFFADLAMPQPSYFLGVGSGSHAQQTAKVITGFEQVCLEARPDYVIVVGDVNSTVACALTSVKLGIRTAHVEAGLRSGDRSMPEEINRLATDAIVNDLFVTEHSGVEHLLSEGAPSSSVHLVGNTMVDSLFWALPLADNSTVLDRLNLRTVPYALVTLHRPSNVDDPEQLRALLTTLATLSEEVAIVFPMHPRTQKHVADLGLSLPAKVIVTEPCGYVDFLALMKNAVCVITDSGGIQEETTALRIPCVTARTTTERPITTEIGTNVLVPPEPEAITVAVRRVLQGNHKHGQVPELWDGHAAERIVSIISRFYE